MTRAVLVAVALLAAGCGAGAGVSPTTTTRAVKGGTTSSCTAVSGGFRACTTFATTSAAFHRIGGGQESRIERRHGSRWSIFLGPDRAPRGGGWWRRVLADRQGKTLLAQWSGECEVQFTYLISTHAPTLRRVFPSHQATSLGWTSDGLARVKLWRSMDAPVAPKTGSARRSGLYLVTAKGHVMHLERAVPLTSAC
jgi:hypothetical protein